MSFSDISSISSKDPFYQADAKFKEELKTFSASGFLGERLIVKRKGEALALSKTNVFFFLLEKFKGLFGFFNGANHRVVEFATLEFLLKGRKWVEQPEDFLRVQALAQRAGLFSCSKNGSSQEKQLIQDIRQTLLSSNEQEKIDDVFYREEIERESGEASSLLDRFSIQYQKELEPFSKEINKVKGAFNQFDIQNRAKDSHVFQKDKSLSTPLDEQEAMVEIAKTSDISPIREEEKFAKHRIKELTAKEIETDSKWSTAMKVGACFIALVAAGLGVYLFSICKGTGAMLQGEPTSLLEKQDLNDLGKDGSILLNEYEGIKLNEEEKIKSSFADNRAQALMQKIQELIAKATELDYGYDYDNLGHMYFDIKDYKNAFIAFRKAAELGNEHSFGWIEQFKTRMEVSESDLASIRKAFNEAVNTEIEELLAKPTRRGSAYDSSQIGDRYCAMKDYKNAFIWYKKAAELGHQDSLTAIEKYKSEMEVSDSDLASIYEAFNEVVNREIRKLVAKAQESQSSEDYWSVGWIYYSKLKDYKNAFIWYRKAAEQGFRLALNRIERNKIQMEVSDSDLASIRKACDEAEANSNRGF